MKRLLFMLIVALAGAAVLSAQNPISIAQIGPVTAVTTTLPISGTVTANAGSGTFAVSGTFFQVTQPVSVASGQIASGAIASGAVASGAYASGSIASGAYASGSYASGSISDGADVTQGTKADARSTATDTTAITIMSVLKQISFMAQTPAALPANQSTNVAQLAGTTTDTNSGTKSAGTLRVVLATDQPALTNKLLVTPDSVALPANQSVNVAQMNGVTTTMGAGATGTGVQRVNDVASAATGAAPPASAIYVGGVSSGATGGFLGGITACDLSKAINIATGTTTLMVTGVSGRQVRICAFHMVTLAANSVAWLEGTGATCGTGTAGMAGGTTAASGYNFAANGGLATGSGLGEVLTTVTTGDSVCLITSATTQLSGFIKYTIF